MDRKIIAWVRIARFPFYPMTWLAYTLGAAVRSALTGKFNPAPYLIGYLVLFLIEFATILANDYFDYESDRQNKNFSMFTGGTRVLVEDRLSFGEVRAGIFAALSLAAVLSCVLVLMTAEPLVLSSLLLIAVGILLGLGYTVPPFKFSYRGAGEVVVGFTHSFYVIICGFVFQGGRWSEPLPWLMSVPLFLAVFGANTLAGIPDWRADRAVMKRSLAVVCGPRTAAAIAIGSVCGAFLSWILLGYFKLIPPCLFTGQPLSCRTASFWCSFSPGSSRRGATKGG